MKLDANQIREIYDGILKSLNKNDYVKTKADEVHYFKDLANIIDILEADPYDYISFFIDKRTNYLLELSVIVNEKSVNRFRVHQKMKNLYANDLYGIEGDTLMVNKTFRKYPLSQVKSVLSQDSDAEWAMMMAESWAIPVREELRNDLRDAVEYTICKFKYKEKPLPEKLIEFRRVLWEEEKSEHTKTQ